MAAADPIKGKTIRWTFNDGPSAGTTYEHDFHSDGTVQFRQVDDSKKEVPASSEKVKYGSARVSDDVYAVSYLSSSGFTLTVVLNFADKKMVAFASNDTQWFEQKGTFEVRD
jgi:hypothetical protein